ncbi:hypothetical protein [Methylomonas koyamae]|uniref:hypothetical protein n=1 Tax=Methylomonas koyamae TaxID=702114 RepID=UPI000BC2FDFB|nr:hypothetical protein [Methylomonas koyamae]ATG90114.1 hypothetical protein MKLM6_1879 [Methylomonas koyamae]
MKRFIRIIVLSTLLPFSIICSAEQVNDPAMTGGMDSAKLEAHLLEAHLKDRQAHELAMHDLSNKILAETDPQKQQALKDQQLELMKAQHLKMMSQHPGKAMGHKKMR